MSRTLSPAAGVAALAADNAEMKRSSPSRELFGRRGISDRVVDALIAFGIDAPERLLFMEEAALAKISGVGPKGRGELQAYRHRFLTADAPPRAADHPKPVGPATDAVREMDKAIKKDRSRSEK